MVKLNLKYSILNKEDDEVLIVVPDIKRGAKVDYQPTIEYYTNLFREHGVNDLGYRVTIMPFNQLRQEYKTFESLRKLGASYEHFLCEGRIVGHAVGFVGKIFQKPRNTFHAVHFDKVEKLKERLQKALCRTSYKQLHKGDVISIPVGNHLYSAQQLTENVFLVVQQLKELYAGGWPNIRNIYLKLGIGATTALPLFISNCKAPSHTPYVVGPKEKRMLKLKREANAVLEKFDLDKKGDLKKLKKKEIQKKHKTIEYRKALLEAEKHKMNMEDGNSVKKSKKTKLDDKVENSKKKRKLVEKLSENKINNSKEDNNGVEKYENSE